MKSAEYDWKTAGHLFEKRNYPYALFFGHLTIEKILKAIFACKFDETPPLTHRLTYLAEKIGMDLSAEKQELLEIVTDFNLKPGILMKDSCFIKNARENSLIKN